MNSCHDKLIVKENWKRRTEIIEYCVGVVDKSMEEKKLTLQQESTVPAVQRQIQGALYAEEVKVRGRLLCPFDPN